MSFTLNNFYNILHSINYCHKILWALLSDNFSSHLIFEELFAKYRILGCQISPHKYFIILIYYLLTWRTLIFILTFSYLVCYFACLLYIWLGCFLMWFSINYVFITSIKYEKFDHHFFKYFFLAVSLVLLYTFLFSHVNLWKFLLIHKTIFTSFWASSIIPVIP